jgi:hypothetical protein
MISCVAKTAVTKLSNGTIQDVSAESIGKTVVGRTTETAFLPGTVGGSAAGTAYGLVCPDGNCGKLYVLSA